MGSTLRSVPWTAMFGILVLLATAILGICAPCSAPYGETQTVGAGYMPWGGDHLLGPDNLGRDILSRMIHGARTTVGPAVLTTAITFTIGASLGMAAALKGGWDDQI